MILHRFCDLVSLPKAVGIAASHNPELDRELIRQQMIQFRRLINRNKCPYAKRHAPGNCPVNGDLGSTPTRDPAIIFASRVSAAKSQLVANQTIGALVYNLRTMPLRAAYTAGSDWNIQIGLNAGERRARIISGDLNSGNWQLLRTVLEGLEKMAPDS